MKQVMVLISMILLGVVLSISVLSLGDNADTTNAENGIKAVAEAKIDGTTSDPTISYDLPS